MFVRKLCGTLVHQISAGRSSQCLTSLMRQATTDRLERSVLAEDVFDWGLTVNEFHNVIDCLI